MALEQQHGVPIRVEGDLDMVPGDGAITSE
jgi:hypothetical protein